MLVFAIDDVLKGAVDVIRDLLRAPIGLLDGVALVHLILLGAAGRLRRIIQDSELFGTLLYRTL